MAIDFPNSPTVNQTFTSGSTTWVWDGTAWNLQTTTTASNDSMPVGSIMWFAGSTTPTGWIRADGTVYPNSTYPNLYAAIGNTYGGTVGTSFAVPSVASTTGAYYIRFTTAVGVTSTLSLLSAPVGSMVQWPVTSSYPTGWIRCDGASYSTTTYNDLFTLIQYTYGGSGSSFNVPNISGAGAGSPVYVIKATSSGLIEPSTVSHASSHIRGGSDIIDADRDQIDFVPTYYTRDSSPTQAGASTDLTAHLKGIDNALVPFPTGSNYLYAASATTVTGGANSNFAYTPATITLTPGSWIVQGQLSLTNTVTSDDSLCSLYNVTTSSEVANSRGADGITTTTVFNSFSSAMTLMTVASNTQVCPYGVRNGGSTLRARTQTNMGNTAGLITAFKLKY